MSKELPYFKFEPSEYLAGNIQDCSYEAQGVFINICSLYWIRLGELPYASALQRICKGIPSALQELCNNGILNVENDQIVIEFLDEQLNEFQETSEKRAKAANKRWSNASAMQVHSKCNAIREEKIREEEIREEDKTELLIYPTFEDFWDTYDKKVDNKPKCISKWNKQPQDIKEKIIDHVKAYVISTPDKQYRKNPLTYLNNEGWDNEIINGKEKLISWN